MKKEITPQDIIMNQIMNNQKKTLVPIFDPRKMGGVSSVREHDCWHYTECIYKIGGEGSARLCQTCDKILEFRYRSFWKRLLRVFVDF